MGPAFKKGYRTGTLWNIDIYPLLCEIFDIMPRQNIDGKLERIGFEINIFYVLIFEIKFCIFFVKY